MNINEIREDTPHCKNKIFVNSAGSSLMPRPVLAAIINYLQHEEEIGGYKLSDIKRNEIDGFYTQCAQLLNCNPRNISFAHDATDAYSKALSSIKFSVDDIILTTDDDYVSNHISFLSLEKRYGVKIVKSKNLENGDIDLVHFEELVHQHRPKVVSVTHVPTNSGLIQDVVQVGKICREHNILYLLDACQSIGQLDVDVQLIQCDFLSATGRKFLRGPRGTGLLYVSDRVLEKGFAPLYLDLHGAKWTRENFYEMIPDASRFEMWEKPYALVVGLKEALLYLNTIGIKEIENYNYILKTRLNDNLKNISGVSQYDQGSRTANIITFRKENKTLSQTKNQLDAHDIYYSVAHKEGALIDFSKKGVDWTIRLSPHYFNTVGEMDRLAEVIDEL